MMTDMNGNSIKIVALVTVSENFCLDKEKKIFFWLTTLKAWGPGHDICHFLGVCQL